MEDTFEGGQQSVFIQHGTITGRLLWDNPDADVLGDIRRFKQDAASRPFVPFTPFWGDFTPEAVFTAIGLRGGTNLRCSVATADDEYCPWHRKLFRDRRGHAPAYAAYRRHLRRDHGIEPVL